MNQTLEWSGAHARTGIQFIVRWVTVTATGWSLLGMRTVRFQFDVLRSLSPAMHGFIIASVAVGTLPVAGWFRYSLSLDGLEVYEITTNLWYLFFLPGVCAMLLIFYPFRQASRVQWAISGLILLLYCIAFFFPEGRHYELKIQPRPTLYYYLYAVALIAQTILTPVLMKPVNGIFFRMREQWKK